MSNLNATNQVRFYEGSYNFKTDMTNLNVTEDYVQMQLAKQYEYRTEYSTQTETLWAEVAIGDEVTRYEFDYLTGLIKI